MTKFKIVILISMLGLALYLGVFKARKPVVVDNPDIWIDEEPIAETPVKSSLWETEEEEFYKITYNLSGITDENVKPDIERWVSDRVSQFKSESGFENITEEDKEILGFNRGMKYTLDFNFELKESSKIKTYIIKSSVFTGGAHGNLEVLTFNYEKEGGKRISLNDVFLKKPQEYLPVLAALGDKFLESKYKDVAFYEGLAPEPANWTTWYTTDTSIVFIFQTYQVVPYAYGTPEFEVKASGVADFINTKYFTN
ncbi:MAG: hypothetical protein QG654_73 [Patescibacteria group bacterium]|nr:hypothetical protein [Patescibacteria group bacterium]